MGPSSIRAGINLNPYQGLKPKYQMLAPGVEDSRNQPKSLSGIETAQLSPELRCWAANAGINLNPYQGLKPATNPDFGTVIYAGINLNPYQGLKLTDALSSLASNAPEST